MAAFDVHWVVGELRDERALPTGVLRSAMACRSAGVGG
jgi:hypothetical protein